MALIIYFLCVHVAVHVQAAQCCAYLSLQAIADFTLCVYLAYYFLSSIFFQFLSAFLWIINLIVISLSYSLFIM